MAVSVDALTTINVLDSIKSCSKNKLLSCLSSLDESGLKHLVFSSLMQSQPQLKPFIDNIYRIDTQQMAGCITHIQQYFNNNDNENNNCNQNESNSDNLFTSLPSTIGAYIISFGTMRDRLIYELISKDFYKFSQIPTAKYHLIIDHKFAQALYYDAIRIKKFFNVQYLEIKYVFKDTYFETFQDKYYSMIAKILSKSPLLHTIKYELQHRRFKGKLSQKGEGESSYNGHMLEWMELIKNNKYSKENIFNSITKLIYIPSQTFLDYRRISSTWRLRYDLFVKFFPNLVSFLLPKCRVYRAKMQSFWNSTYTLPCHDDADCDWNIFKRSTYNDKLQYIECNMDINSRRICYSDSYRHINVINHPLAYFNKFTQLKVLKLKLPVFENCQNYYHQFMAANVGDISSRKCLNVTEIALEFVHTHHFNFEADPDIVVDSQSDIQRVRSDVIDELCKFVLSHCPNIKRYHLITNQIGIFGDKKYNHLIGFYDRLESLYTDLPSIINQADIRMIGLKNLTIQSCNLFEPVSLMSIFNDLNGFPNLECLKCVNINKANVKWTDLNEHIYDFLSFVSKQKYNKKLKYIGIYHETNLTNREKKRSEYFNLKTCNKSSSLKLCKLIIALTTMTNNFNMKSIELNPVAFKQKELEYIYFWFNGKIDTNKYVKKSQNILTDIYCIQ